MKSQRAFSLTEALVGIAIISLGALGVARMQIAALRGNEAAYYQTQATLIANDVIERIRANPPRIGNADTLRLYDSTYSDGTSNPFDLTTDAFNCTPDGVTATFLRCADRINPTTTSQEAASKVECNTPRKMAAYDLFVVKCGLPYGSTANDFSGGFERTLPARNWNAAGDTLSSGPATLSITCPAPIASPCTQMQLILTWGTRTIPKQSLSANASNNKFNNPDADQFIQIDFTP